MRFWIAGLVLVSSSVLAGGGGGAVAYRCDSGATLYAVYAGDTATVSYRGRRYQMKTAVSADGARYVSGNLEWWTRGRGGFWATLKPDRILDRCEEQ